MLVFLDPAFLVPLCCTGPSSEYVLTAPIINHQRTNVIPKRDTNIVALANDLFDAHYTINITLGTPPQSFGLHLDTGSSDTHMLTPDACQSVGASGKKFKILRNR